MTKIFTTFFVIGLLTLVSSTISSCSADKDKYYYMHQAVDLQKEYEEASKAQDIEKMTSIQAQQDICARNLENAIKVETKQNSK